MSISQNFDQHPNVIRLYYQHCITLKTESHVKYCVMHFWKHLIYFSHKIYIVSLSNSESFLLLFTVYDLPRLVGRKQSTSQQGSNCCSHLQQSPFRCVGSPGGNTSIHSQSCAESITQSQCGEHAESCCQRCAVSLVSQYRYFKKESLLRRG